MKRSNDIDQVLIDLRSNNPSNLNFCYLNINSVRNKFTDFQEIINGNVNIISIAEIDASFPSAQFTFEGYHSLYRLDVTNRSGGILVYVKSSIPSRCLSCENLCDSIQTVPFEINLRKEKWLVISIYRPPSHGSEYFLNSLTKMIDLFAVTYDNYLIMADFNMEPSDPSLKAFLNSNNLYNLIKSNTCFKGKGSCIDLFLTNRKYSFKCSDSYETGISDHHHMIYTMLKSCFNNTEPKLLNYRDFKHFSQEDFKEDLSEALCDCGNSYDDYDPIFTSKLNKHAPKKKKWIRGNNKPRVNKALRQAIMKRSKLKNKAKNTKDPTDIRNYKKQRNYVVNLNKEAKLEYFSKYESDDNKPFWVRCKPYFTNKHSKADTDIMLSENGELILKNKEIANTFNDHFGSIVDIIKRYKNHPSIKNIKAKFNSVRIFSFQPVSVDDVKTVIRDLKNNKSAGREIPIQILKESEFTFGILTNCINKSSETGCFPDNLKAANITPIFKKDDTLDKANYRPVSILPLISKVYERLIYNQLSEYSESFLSHILCGFRKAYSTQHALFKLFQSWQKELDNGGFVGTILMDLSKAYDCIPHELLIAKLKCYGIGNGSLRLLLDYLTNRKQRMKIGSSFSSWCDINTGVPQGSILGPLLFNIFINDLFFSITKSEYCNFADDNTLYSCNKNLEHAFLNLKYDLRNVLDWFKIAPFNIAPFSLNVNGKIISSSNEVKLLGITIDNQLKFKKHIEELCKKASYKLHALRRIRGYLTVEKARILANLLLN